MNLRHQFLASVPRGFADLLQGELAGFGALDLRERGNAVSFTGSLEVAYRACLESRVASRVVLELGRFEADTDAAIYAALRALDWNAHVAWSRFLGENDDALGFRDYFEIGAGVAMPVTVGGTTLLTLSGAVMIGEDVSGWSFGGSLAF